MQAPDWTCFNYEAQQYVWILAIEVQLAEEKPS